MSYFWKEPAYQNWQVNWPHGSTKFLRFRYAEKYEVLQSFVQSFSGAISQKVYAFTIRDTTYLRAEPSAKSKRLTTIVYDTKLLILSSDTPRWLRVEYSDNQGNIIVE